MIVTPNPENNLPSADPTTLDAIRDGDSEAFEALVSELTPGLRGLAQTYVTNALAEEVVQETWAAVVKSLDSFEGRSSLKTWIYRIMLNKVRTLAGREARIVPFAALGLGDDGVSPSVEPERFGDRLLTGGDWVIPPTAWSDTPSEELENDEVLDLVRDAIAELPGSQREVVELSDVQQLPPAVVCDALGISAVNQRVLLHRGRASVRNKLEKYYDTAA